MALIYLLSTVHIHPDNMMLRNVLANFLLSNYKKSHKYLIAASRIAQSTISLQLTSCQRFDNVFLFTATITKFKCFIAVQTHHSMQRNQWQSQAKQWKVLINI